MIRKMKNEKFRNSNKNYGRDGEGHYILVKGKKLSGGHFNS